MSSLSTHTHTTEVAQAAPDVSARAQAIREVVEKRGIKSLYHFTRAKALRGIHEMGGLLTREEVEQLPPDYWHFSDQSRLDGRPNTVSLSIGFPNYKMFYGKRISAAIDDGDWVVFKICPSVLWEKPALFFQINAATGWMIETPEDELNDSIALEACFDPYVRSRHKNYGRTVKTESYYTTDPQAEVMIQDSIEAPYVQGILFHSQESGQHWVRQCPGLFESYKCLVGPDFFKQRRDFR
jgi:hypothetical protein